MECMLVHCPHTFPEGHCGCQGASVRHHLQSNSADITLIKPANPNQCYMTSHSRVLFKILNNSADQCLQEAPSYSNCKSAVADLTCIGHTLLVHGMHDSALVACNETD